MSEYQYYEFTAVDKPLNEKDMQALRNLSTRAQITPSSFVNEYNWGNFKGDPLKLVEKYFDAFLYVANWGTRWFMLKVPRHLVDVDLAKKYCPGNSAVIHEKGNHLIFEFTSETEDYEWEEGEGWLSSLISLRADILNSDYRSLYLAWLFCVQMEEMEDDELEPPVPPNLADLNAPLKSLVDFMRIDTDLIAVAAENSTSEDRQTDPEALKTWIHNLPASEKDDVLFRLVKAPSPHLGTELMHRFQQTVSTTANSKIDNQLRRVKDLISRAETYAEERKRRAAEKKARDQARKKRERALAREEYLTSLAGREESSWKKVDELIDSKQPAKYDEAVTLLVDLRDLPKKTGTEKAFKQKLKTICETHHRKVSFLNRLQKAGLRG
jgi:ribosomal protein S21